MPQPSTILVKNKKSYVTNVHEILYKYLSCDLTLYLVIITL